MKKFILAAAMTALMSGTALAANIGVSMALFDDNFLTVLRNGMIEQAKGMDGVNLQVEDAQNDVADSLTRLRTSSPRALMRSLRTRLTPRRPRP
jgi:inositol transport system substrate-binding protein